MLLVDRDQGPGVDGRDIHLLKIFFLRLAAAAVSYGIFFCVGTSSLYSLIRRGLSCQRARKILIGFTITMLVAATAHLGLYMGQILLQFPSLAAEYVNRSALLRRLTITQTCLRRLTYFQSDIIVVWRAWAIWEGNIYVHIILALCIVATGATSLTVLVFNFKSTFDGVRYTRDTQNFLGTFSLLVTNFTATAFIGWKLWYYRKNIKKYINRSKKGHTRVESIMILLMESGGLYCIFWILLMIGDYGYFGPDFGLEWFQPNISGLYPTIIIFMVSRQMMISEEVFSFGSDSFAASSAGVQATVWIPAQRQSYPATELSDDALELAKSDVAP
ncbi:hypothetical protein MIND_00007400 [Mycena indigotica]|uniref:Uncharacterized protein n=1 Tax=Mycena indigotica TaxID=2126181 RepID=A0A8H6WJV2_9AGAR|nr:uncharacterized protein MIND_00007400 [Mycena indigotica]KAF7314934.1 hypothetical protein MIND_00007400 [Mycena indigotica]